MPAYNAEKYIGESIQSVVDQTYANWELLIVDDGSTDKTENIVRAFAARDSRIKYLSQHNGGPGRARNTGIAESNGTLISFLDSDDLWLPEKLERQLQALDATNADVIYTNGLIIYEPGAVPGRTDFPIVAGTIESRKMLDILLLQNRIPVQSVMVRKEAYRNAGPFTDLKKFRGCEDYELWLRLAAHGALFHGINEQLIKYRRHPGAMTHHDTGWLEPTLRVVSHHIDSGTLDENTKRNRIRRLYREVIAALLEQGELAAAKEFLREFSAWDKAGIVTSLQKLLMKVSPGSFNIISRECLYRAEWHLQKLTGKATSS